MKHMFRQILRSPMCHKPKSHMWGAETLKGAIVPQPLCVVFTSLIMFIQEPTRPWDSGKCLSCHLLQWRCSIIVLHTEKQSSQNICPSREKLPYKCSNNNTSGRDIVSFVIFRLAVFHLFLPKGGGKSFILQLLTFKMISNKKGGYEGLREGNWEVVVSREQSLSVAWWETPGDWQHNNANTLNTTESHTYND